MKRSGIDIDKDDVKRRLIDPLSQLSLNSNDRVPKEPQNDEDLRMDTGDDRVYIDSIDSYLDDDEEGFDQGMLFPRLISIPRTVLAPKLHFYQWPTKAVIPYVPDAVLLWANLVKYINQEVDDEYYFYDSMEIE
uniref:ARAD1C38676p n=1 Tax=Blastobotrys adeninivorans TaxID=409370 RepID=A0A060T384_BLAAD